MYAEKFSDNLKIHLDKLTPMDKKLFNRIYRLSLSEGNMIIPVTMNDWVNDSFGDVDSVKCQEIIKINNVVTYEGAIFNEMRTSRPIVRDIDGTKIEEIIKTNGNRAFANPLEATPSDLFGRIEKDNTITAANIAKYDGMHSLIISTIENPLEITEEVICDYYNTAIEWYKKANEFNAKAIYPFFMWNCLWRAGASIIHGHAQITLTENMPYAKLDLLRRVTEEYESEFGTNYFDDDFKLHKKLGLGFSLDNCNVQMKLTPIKDKEVRITAEEFNSDLIKTTYKILHALIHHVGITSFNLAIYLPPLNETLESWDHMPVIVQIVDRGDLDEKTSDFGVMELYAQSVISSNPYKVMTEIFNNCLNSG